MNKKDINKRIIDRNDCFYWQTDRKITIKESSQIFLNRHECIENEQLIDKVNKYLLDDKLIMIKPFDESSQESSGSVNSNRVGMLKSGKEVIIRCHPKGIKNGYFHVESLAASKAVEKGLPSYKTYVIHDLEGEEDISFQVIEKLKGDTVQYYLREHPECDNKIVYEMGKNIAKLNRIKVEGFGPFDNKKAKKGKLIGIYDCFSEFINAGLEENLNILVENDLISKACASKIVIMFKTTSLLDYNESYLIHNDFPDWNALTNGDRITGIIDFDECVGGHPILDIACWSTFFDPNRVEYFIKGYYDELGKKHEDNFDELFNLFRLRYVISKLTLRINRYNYEKTIFLEELIKNGQMHLKDLLKMFKLEV